MTNLDKFVTASPLIIGACCSDGVILIAVHTSTASEPLLLSNSCNTPGSLDGSQFQTVHPSDRGPFRIERITEGADTREVTCLLSAGWKSHCRSFSDKVRDLVRNDAALFGGGRRNGRCDGMKKSIKALAEDASHWLSSWCFSDDDKNGLSCVGLLASSFSHEERTSTASTTAPVKKTVTSRLYLIDSTGAYRTRAFALGAGSNIMNRKLMFIDFETLSSLEGLKKLTSVMEELCSSTNDRQNEDDEEKASVAAFNEDDQRGIVLPSGSVLEIGILDGISKRLDRTSHLSKEYSRI
eukprot:CAMPEP_0171297408 /NCGR_PEP_ID=MMETSP0816-20121228/6158_1 /TAXON_ID=420281 /ORGANISM="Proboscia inermis, Strain CCAP1064/1" /LENGTH=295 /DNA_ID=CAMNT_0011771663 /DNA_START=65 /DNA_END=952 /DNA_ORIENTATION=-